VAARTPFVTPPPRPGGPGLETKGFRFVLSKKNNKKKAFFLKKEAKTFVCFASSTQANAS
jgi:hypothetical protein